MKLLIWINDKSLKTLKPSMLKVYTDSTDHKSTISKINCRPVRFRVLLIKPDLKAYDGEVTVDIFVSTILCYIFKKYLKN